MQHSKHNTTLYFEDKNNPVGLCFKPLSRTAFLLLIITLPLVVTAINPFTAGCHLKTTNKSAKFEILTLLNYFFALACERIFIKTHNIEIRFVIELQNILLT